MKRNVSSAGNGTLPHITMELLMLREKFQVTNVPYRGAAPAFADLVAGQVQAKLDNYAQSAQFIADRKLNLLVVTSASRLKQFPEVPNRRADCRLRRLPVDGPGRSGSDAGPGGEETRGRGTTICRPIGDAGALRQGGVEPVGSGPAEFNSLIVREIAQWRELARTTKIVVD